MAPAPTLSPSAGLPPTRPSFEVNPFAGMRVPTPPPFAPPRSMAPAPMLSPSAGLRPTRPPFEVNPFSGMRVPTPPLFAPPRSKAPAPTLSPFAGLRVPTPPPFTPAIFPDVPAKPTPLTGMRVTPTCSTPLAGIRIPTPPPFLPKTDDQASALQQNQLSLAWSSLISDAKRFGQCR